MRRGFYGGTFDPVHQGHLQLALFARDYCQFDSLTLIPCHLPPHRAMPVAATHRLAMLQLAIAPYPFLTINEMELKRAQASYTVDTLTLLRQQYPKDSLWFLIGMDSLLSFRRWHRWQDILGLAHLVVFQRPGYSAEAEEAQWLLSRYGSQDLAELDQQLAGRILLLPNPCYDVSATLLRQAPSRAHPLHIPAVQQYILQHQLYGDTVG